MRFARWAFLLAGTYGVLLIGPMYFLEERIGRDTPPAITHPEYFYGFVGVTLAWQLAYLAISRDPVRLRPMMPIAVLAKISFGIAAWLLLFQGRVPGMIAGLATIDLAFAVAFGAAWWRCGPEGAG